MSWLNPNVLGSLLGDSDCRIGHQPQEIAGQYFVCANECDNALKDVRGVVSFHLLQVKSLRELILKIWRLEQATEGQHYH